MNHDASSISNAMGLQSLLDEPTRLAAEAERLNVELEALVMDNYKVFVENLTCSVHLKMEDKKLGEISLELDSNLQDLSQQCISFKDRVSHFVGAHKRNRKTLQHHMQLVELLEVPQLVDACARNGFHDEALELANFVNGLERRHLLASEVKSHNGKLRGGSGVIQTIVDDVHHTLSGLRQQLLMQLTENTTLPKEISILATLRKLDGLMIDRHLSQGRFDVENLPASSSNIVATQQQQREKQRQVLAQTFEVRLQMDFLEARTIWLHNNAERALHTTKPDLAKDASGDSLSAGATSVNGGKPALGPYGKASEMLEIRRTAWFAVITQFNALFQDSHGGSGSSGSGSGSGRDKLAGDAEAVELSSFCAPMAVSAWATRQVSQLLLELQQLLPCIDEGASLRSVLEQALFFASRMSQVGCDFSGLVLPLFQEVMLARFSRELTKAAENFKSIILTERISFEADGDGAAKEQLIPLFASQDTPSSSSSSVTGSSHGAGDSSSASSSSSSAGELAPPQLLMRFPPLAYLLNSILTHMNYLRECPLVTTEQPALDAVFLVIADICAHIVQKATEVRKLGDKYLSASKDGKTKKTAGKEAAEGKQESMDRMYAQAIAQELLPHVMICFETIYAADAARLELRMKAVHAKDVRRRAKTSAQLSCLVSSLYDAKDLFDSESLSRLEKAWAVLVQGGLLGEDALARTAPVVDVPAHSATLAPAAAVPVAPVAPAQTQQSEGDSIEDGPGTSPERDSSKDD